MYVPTYVTQWAMQCSAAQGNLLQYDLLYCNAMLTYVVSYFVLLFYVNIDHSTTQRVSNYESAAKKVRVSNYPE